MDATSSSPPLAEGRIVLAHGTPFALGASWVEPGTRQIACGSRSETLEPRVMQVLVALALADGAIVTRDELIARCWDGRIVSDDAINRVLSRLRQVAAGIGGSSFAIETIARVGYRLREWPRGDVVVPFPGSATPDGLPHARGGNGRGVGRRALIAGGAALAVTAGALTLWKPWDSPAEAEARQLVERGNLLMREGLPGQIRQAASYFERATVLDSGNAEAWGGLALAYSHQMQGFDEGETGSLPGLIRAAAARANALDPGNGDADMAVIFITPVFGNWVEKEQRLRQLIARHPRQWLAHGRLGYVLQQVGRFEEALASNRRALAIEPMLPISHSFIINALTALGRIQEGDAAIAYAAARWPANPALWFVSFEHLLFSGRPERAIALLEDPARRPSNLPPELVALLRSVAGQAIEGVNRSPAVTDRLMAEASAHLELRPFAARFFALLGRTAEAFELLEGYLLPGGRPAAGRRGTDVLFLPPLGQLRDDARMRRLRERVGLASYWRATGSRPDA